jgi:hypothetical protein
MPNADFTSWTPLSAISGKIAEWAQSTGSLKSGLYEIVTQKNETTFKHQQ